jgi:phosphoenolpyruvate carboxykinase (GTP)
MWPGFGENSRVLEWVFRRCEGKADAVETAIGLVPAPGALNTDGLEGVDVDALLAVDEDGVRAELPQVEEHLAKFGATLPAEVRAQLDALKQRLAA